MENDGKETSASWEKREKMRPTYFLFSFLYHDGLVELPALESCGSDSRSSVAVEAKWRRSAVPQKVPQAPAATRVRLSSTSASWR